MSRAPPAPRPEPAPSLPPRAGVPAALRRALSPRAEFVINPNGKSEVCILHEYMQRVLKVRPVYGFFECGERPPARRPPAPAPVPRPQLLPTVPRPQLPPRPGLPVPACLLRLG